MTSLLARLFPNAATAPPPAASYVPDSLQVAPRHVATGGQLSATLVVVGYPAEVSPGWLEPLTTYPGRVDVALHIDPLPNAVAAGRLRTQRARLESTRRAGYSSGQLEDPGTEAAAEDAAELSRSLARGEVRLFRVGLYLTVHAADAEKLAEVVAAVRAIAESLLLTTAPTTYRSLRGWTTTRPFATDLLGQTRTFDTPALAAAFPFSSPDLPASGGEGVLYGANLNSASLVVWDRWSRDNYNSLTLARSGAGKSYLTKLDVLRSLYQGVEVAVIDPEEEYTRLATAVGGTVITPGAAGERINPLDLSAPTDSEPGGPARRALFLHALLPVMLGGPLDPAEHAVVDRAILDTYAAAGISDAPDTWARPAPVLADLAATLARTGTDPGQRVAERLAPYVTGSHKELFDGPSTTAPDGHLVVYAVRHLPEQLKAVGMMLTLDAIWRRVANGPARRRLVVVDEAWLLMREHEGAEFLFRMAKGARKRWAGLAVVTQDAADVLSSDLGRAVAANAATQVLLKQAPQVINAVTDTFHLSDGERQFLLTASRGEGLLLADRAGVAFTAWASPDEDALITTDPEADH